MSYQGLLYDGESARAVPVTWQVSAGVLQIRGEGVERQVRVSVVRATSRLGSIRRMAYLPGGEQLHSDDNEAMDQLVSRGSVEAVTDRLERHAVSVAASFLLTMGLVAWFFTLGLPWLADRTARAIPPEVEDAIGGQVVSVMDQSVLSESTLDAEIQAHYQALFDGFVADLPDAGRYQLQFRLMNGHAANAFALPGGMVVFTDGLVEMIGEDEEFLAVLAHEIGHHRERHLLRSVLQSSAVVVLGTVIAGDVSGATALMIGLPTFLLENHYSRSFESEADRFAFAALRESGISPAWFARIMDRLAAAQGEEAPQGEEGSLLSYASTHPPPSARVSLAWKAGAGLPPPGRIIADREAARLAAAANMEGADVGDISPGELAGCLAGSFTMEGGEGTTEWVQRTNLDGTLVISTTYPDGSVGRSQGYWVLAGRSLVEYVAGVDEGSGAESPTGDLYRYRLLSVEPDQLVYAEPETGEESVVARVACTEGEESAFGVMGDAAATNLPRVSWRAAVQYGRREPHPPVGWAYQAGWSGGQRLAYCRGKLGRGCETGGSLSASRWTPPGAGPCRTSTSRSPTRALQPNRRPG